MKTFKVGEVVIFEKICKKIYQRISNLENWIGELLVGRSDLNCNID